ncbi:MAG TPA: hypothetical protein VMW08_00550 [Acidimicrobiales bacterium]|nr:hypothetical protein [Acidimicrobiales bacterium]
MGWWAHLADDRGNDEGSWNFTHNTNGMIAEALQAATGETVEECGGPLGPVIGPAWWERLNGMTGPEGGEFLDTIVKALMADPVRFEAMNPENGWGSYESLLKVLADMRDSVPEWPCVWQASG